MKKTNPLKIVEIVNYANNLRKELGIPSNSFFPVLEVMEKFHVDGLLTIQYLEDDDSLFEDDSSLDIYKGEYIVEKIDGGFRKKVELIPFEAYREALANAIVHRTWDINANTKIEMY